MQIYHKTKIKGTETRRCATCKKYFIVVTKGHSHVIFCKKCSQKKCVRCWIILNKIKCVCGDKHGMPSKRMPDFYCKDCLDYLIKRKMPTPIIRNTTHFFGERR